MNNGLQILMGWQTYELWAANINGSASFQDSWAANIYGLANLRIMAPKYCLQAYELWGPNINGPLNL